MSQRVATTGLVVVPRIAFPRNPSHTAPTFHRPELTDDVLTPGAALGNYRIDRTLGRGGMGAVCLGYDTALHRQVALKILIGPAGGETPRRLLVREARNAAGLSHPNICTIYEVGEADGLAFIAMEYLEGHSLGERIDAGTLSVDEAIDFGRHAADALAYAHRRGVVHRDLKAANVIVNDDGRLKIVDFGLARRYDASIDAATTQATLVPVGSVAGTPYAMAPEQVRGENADQRTDIWALGVLLYEMASRRKPFEGATTPELFSSILRDAPAALPAGVPVALRAVVERCLEKAPGRRYQDATEVLDALEAIRIGTVPAAVGWRYRMRRLQHLVPGAALFALVLVGMAGGWALWQRTRPGDGARVSSTADAAHSTIRPLTSFVGWELAPSWSPDGSQFAYTQVRGSSADVAVIAPGGEPHVLTAGSPADEFMPRWSPTGSKIAFLSDRGAGTNIYTVPASGGAEQKIVETGIPFLQRMGAWAGALGANPWSPDERQLVFARVQPAGEVALWKVTLATGEEKQLTSPPAGAEDTDAAWSWNGDQIVFARSNKGLSALWVVAADGGGERLFFGEGPVNVSPAWTPEDRSVLFMSVIGGAPNLWELDRGASKPRRLTFGPGADIWPVVARNGSIAYAQYGHDVHVYQARIDARDQEDQALVAFTGENFAPRVSINGSILYTSTRSGNNEIWLLDRKSSVTRNLTQNPASDRLADWSPDGQEIVFMSDRDGAVKLWVLQVDTGRTRLLTDRALPWAGHTAEAEGGPRWSPDGGRIGYLAPTETGRAIWVVDPDGKNAHATAIRGASSFSWYKDGQRVLYIRPAADGSGRQELRTAHLTTGEDRVLRTGHIAEVAAPPDGRALSFLDAVSHFMMELYVLRLTPTSRHDQLPRPDGDPRRTTFGKGQWHAHAGGWTPDGRALVYSRDRDFGDIFTIETRSR